MSNKLIYKQINKKRPPTSGDNYGGQWVDMTNFASMADISGLSSLPVDVPYIENPDSNFIVKEPFFRGSELSYTGNNPITHISTDWEIATDPEFNNIVDSVYNKSFNLREWTSSIGNEYKEVYVRVRYNTSAGLTAWSKPVYYTLNIPVQMPAPGIIVQTYSERPMDYLAESAIVEATPYEDGGDPTNNHIATVWTVTDINDIPIFSITVNEGDLTRYKLPGSINFRPEDNLKIKVQYVGAKASSAIGELTVANRRQRLDDYYTTFRFSLPEGISRNAIVSLKDGSLLSLGGFNRQGSTVSSVSNYRVFIETNTVNKIPDLPLGINLDWATASLLLDGRVFVGSGIDRSKATLTLIPNSFIYDPDSETWTTVPQMPEPAYKVGQVTLPDGRVMVAGGELADGLSATEVVRIYDPILNSWSLANNIENVPQVNLTDTVSRSLGLTRNNEVVYYSGGNFELIPGIPTFFKLVENSQSPMQTWEPMNITGFSTDPIDIQLVNTLGKYEITIVGVKNTTNAGSGVVYPGSSNIIYNEIGFNEDIAARAGVRNDGTIVWLGGGGSGNGINGDSRNTIFARFARYDYGTTTSTSTSYEPTSSTSTSSFTSSYE